MKECIEKTAALDICQKEYEERLRMADYCGDTVAWNIGGAIKSIPTADVVEVRHGRWLTTDAYPHHLYCSVCYKTYAKNAKWVNELDLPTNYCPNCGARMGKEDEHEAG